MIAIYVCRSGKHYALEFRRFRKQADCEAKRAELDARAGGCTAPNFAIREPFQTRLTPFRDARARRPSYHQFDVNLSKRFRITERTSFQFRLEAYNVTHTPMYNERVYNRTTTDSLFGSINKNTERQSNFPRFYQIGMKFLF